MDIFIYLVLPALLLCQAMTSVLLPYMTLFFIPTNKHHQHRGEALVLLSIAVETLQLTKCF